MSVVCKRCAELVCVRRKLAEAPTVDEIGRTRIAIERMHIGQETRIISRCQDRDEVNSSSDAGSTNMYDPCGSGDGCPQVSARRSEIRQVQAGKGKGQFVKQEKVRRNT